MSKSFCQDCEFWTRCSTSHGNFNDNYFMYCKKFGERSLAKRRKLCNGKHKIVMKNITIGLTNEQLLRAEELATARAEAEAYKLTEMIAPELQKKTFDAYKALFTIGVRFVIEEIYNIQEENNKQR